MEYAIWGIPPGQSDETLLVAMPGGKPITSAFQANRLAELMADKHKCTKVRVQKLDGSIPGFHHLS